MALNKIENIIFNIGIIMAMILFSAMIMFLLIIGVKSFIEIVGFKALIIGLPVMSFIFYIAYLSEKKHMRYN